MPDDINWDLIARGRDRGGKPSQLSAEERTARKEHWIRLKVELENRGIYTTPWEAYHTGEMPPDLAEPLREALERTRRDEIRRAPVHKGWDDWIRVGVKVKGIGRWRTGMIGTVEELRTQGGRTYAIVKFDHDSFAFESGEIEEVKDV
ncbi:MAG TPA: hypothetical protein VFK94_06585 [Patescibacteria group bacterium]|nr:hypothetical protein [Patescibacteria group bacterium]